MQYQLKSFNRETIMDNEKNNSPIKTVSWYQTMNRYHWFVFVVCSLGWAFDCFDQQLFAIVRMQALADVMTLDQGAPAVQGMAGYATSFMLLGWATGGIFFGIMGDKIGRAKTMVFTIITYALFTGMSGLSTSWFDFILYRFLTGLGIGGQFAAGVTLLSETMPDRARPKTLGMLQIVAAFGNISAAVLVMLLGFLSQRDMLGGYIPWRIAFFVGFLPALLAVVVMNKLEEPEKWKAAVAAGGVKKAGSIADLFSHPRWRYNVIIGMLLATCGVIGLWGITFFSVNLTQLVIRKTENEKIRTSNAYERDYQFLRSLAADPGAGTDIVKERFLTPMKLIGEDAKVNDSEAIMTAINELHKNAVDKNAPISSEMILNFLDNPGDKRKPQTAEAKARRVKILAGPVESVNGETLTELADQIKQRSGAVQGVANWWGGIASLLFNFGAIFGTLLFTICAERFGRRPAFTIAFTASLFMTVFVFLRLNSWVDVLWMQPLLGFCTLSLFGGYAIYFPELFPTHLRSTAVSFCYNIGRYIAALGPAALGFLTSVVFAATDEPLRYAGAVMSITFIFGIIVTWLGPETKGKPLPE